MRPSWPAPNSKRFLDVFRVDRRFLRPEGYRGVCPPTSRLLYALLAYRFALLALSDGCSVAWTGWIGELIGFIMWSICLIYLAWSTVRALPFLPCAVEPGCLPGRPPFTSDLLLDRTTLVTGFYLIV